MGHDRREKLHRSGLVFYHRLVSHLSRGEGNRAAERVDSGMDSLHRHGFGEFFWGCSIWLLGEERLAGDRGAKGGHGLRRDWRDASHSNRSHEQFVRDYTIVRTVYVRLWLVHNHGQCDAGG